MPPQGGEAVMASLPPEQNLFFKNAARTAPVQTAPGPAGFLPVRRAPTHTNAVIAPRRNTSSSITPADRLTSTIFHRVQPRSSVTLNSGTSRSRTSSSQATASMASPRATPTAAVLVHRSFGALVFRGFAGSFARSRGTKSAGTDDKCDEGMSGEDIRPRDR